MNYYCIFFSLEIMPLWSVVDDTVKGSLSFDTPTPLLLLNPTRML